MSATLRAVARAQTPSGVLVLDKPRGPTSHDVVVRIRRTLGVREVGHAGTLDPMATGVLVLAIGEATKLVPWLTADDKTYEATIELGIETDTLDADGRAVRRSSPPEAVQVALRDSAAAGSAAPPLAAAIAAERARTHQVPPAFSAIKQGGEPAYAKARRGDCPALDARPVAVRRIELVRCREEPPSLDVVVEVAKGYYVRSLARDLAQTLGTVGHLTSLRRTRSGDFAFNESLPLETPRDDLLARMCPLPRAAARVLPICVLTEEGARDARHGRPVSARDIDPPRVLVSGWLDLRGDLVAIGRVGDDGRGSVLRGFRDMPGL